MTGREGPTGVLDEPRRVDGICAGVRHKVSAKRIRELYSGVVASHGSQEAKRFGTGSVKHVREFYMIDYVL